MDTPETPVVPSAVPAPPDATDKGNGKPKRVRVTITSLRAQIEYEQQRVASLRMTTDGLRGLLREANTERFDLSDKLRAAEAKNTEQAATLANTQTALEFTLSMPTQDLAPGDLLEMMENAATEYGYDFPSFYPEFQAALSKAYAKAPQRAARARDDKKLAELDDLDRYLAGPDDIFSVLADMLGKRR